MERHRKVWKRHRDVGKAYECEGKASSLIQLQMNVKIPVISVTDIGISWNAMKG